MTTQDSAAQHDSQADGRRLILVSNRLPIALERDDDGAWSAQSSTGGLVAALDPVIRQRGGIWIGWPGVAETDTEELRATLRQHNQNGAYRLEPVALSAADIHGFYEGFSNEIIWPLFHNQFTACNFEPDFWRVYTRVNRAFARTIGTVADADDFIWVHDYHLMHVARDLRAQGHANRTGFFQHIPFPTLDIFSNLPWWREIIYSLLAFDFVGFQTPGDRKNFLACVDTLCTRVSAQGDGDRTDVEVHDDALPGGYRRLGVGALPIGIDYASIAATAAGEEATRFLDTHRSSWSAAQIALGVDRLDYTKGLPQKLQAFRNALERYPELQGRLSLHQHVIPSREEVPEYADQKATIEQMVGEINGEFTRPGWVPVHYFFHRMKPAELMAYYRLANIALITPLKDGMNLVAKEYCAANVNENGVVVLSEFAGSLGELGANALAVNPHDVEGTADRIYEAYSMPAEERHRRMRAMRAIVREHDAFDWVRRFLEAAGADAPVR